MILLFVFLINPTKVQTTEFRCQHHPECTIHYESYFCLKREEVQSCKTPPAGIAEQTAKGTCKRKCHFNLRCGSYTYDPVNSLCHQCSFSAMALHENHSYTHSLPMKPKDTDGARKLGYGVHSGHLLSMQVDGVDYLERGYIDSSSVGFEILATLIPLRSEELVWIFKGPFCVLKPIQRSIQDKLYSSVSPWRQIKGKLSLVPL